ncbi:MAG: peptidyl-prolyl cis-trans isomerase [Rhodoferax sp.]|nr:peptidyl-prolyl cis-trans isomerase [Rhodoferax sp.]
MFDFVRQHTKIMMFVLFLLVIPSFVLFGIDGYNSLRAGGDVVATVAGQDITSNEWDSAHRAEVERLRAAMPNLDPKLLDSEQGRQATLERLVRERVLMKAAEDLRLQTTDARLAQALQENPSIADLRRPDGSLDMDRYRQLAASQGLTPEGFEARVRRDLSQRQIESALTASGLVPPSVAAVSLNAFFERREVRVARFAAADFATRLAPSDAELEAYYKAHPGEFQAPEQMRVEYLVLDLDAVKRGIAISEADLRTYYEQNAARLASAEERRASHILIASPKDAPAAEREKARQRAAELVVQARKSPDAFAELARKHSQDAGSATRGGDLDFFGRGAMVKPFEDATFAMKKGDISDVVASDFGYHIIKLTDIKLPAQRSFEEMRAKLEADLRAQQAQRKFAESAEVFTNTVYEQSDSLKPEADKLKLDIRTADKLTREGAAALSAQLGNPKVLAALFSPDAIDKKRNTEAIETGPSQLLSARVVQHTPARTLPLEEVRAAVRERVVASQSAELARKEGAAKLTAWMADRSAASLQAPVVVSRDKPQNLPPEIVKAALRADPSKLPALVGVDLGPQGYAVVGVDKIVPRDPPAESVAQQEQTAYAQGWSAAEVQAYYEGLKDRYKVSFRAPKPKLSQ